MNGMNFPEFKRRKVFLEEVEIPCLFAKIKNSALTTVAKRYLAKHKKDFDCEIVVRSKDPKALSTQTLELLKRLLNEGGLAHAIDEGMRDYAASSNAPFASGDSVSPDTVVQTVIVDEIRDEVILECSAELNADLMEHGIAICKRDGLWKFNRSDFVSEYLTEVEDEATQKEWEAVRLPHFPPENEVSEDVSGIYGTWRFDEAESLALLARLKVSQREMRDVLNNCGSRRWDISPNKFVEFAGMPVQRGEYDLVRLERQGERVVIHFKLPRKDKVIVQEMLFCGGYWLGLDGVALKKTAQA